MRLFPGFINSSTAYLIVIQLSVLCWCVCVCRYTDGSSVGCCNTCSEEPRSDMLAMKNPTCDLRT